MRRIWSWHDGTAEIGKKHEKDLELVLWNGNDKEEISHQLSGFSPISHPDTWPVFLPYFEEEPFRADQKYSGRESVFHRRQYGKEYTKGKR